MILLTTIFRKIRPFALDWIKLWNVFIINFSSLNFIPSILWFHDLLLDNILLILEKQIFAQIFGLNFCWLLWLVITVSFLYFEQVLFGPPDWDLGLLVTVNSTGALSPFFVLVVELAHVARLTLAHLPGAADLRLGSVAADRTLLTNGDVARKGLDVGNGTLAGL